MKDYLVAYSTKEYGSTTWVRATDKLEARRKAKRKGRTHVKIYYNQKDIDRVDDQHQRMWLTNIWTKVKKGYFPYESEDFDRVNSREQA